MQLGLGIEYGKSSPSHAIFRGVQREVDFGPCCGAAGEGVSNFSNMGHCVGRSFNTGACGPSLKPSTCS